MHIAPIRDFLPLSNTPCQLLQSLPLDSQSSCKREVIYATSVWQSRRCVLLAVIICARLFGVGSTGAFQTECSTPRCAPWRTPSASEKSFSSCWTPKDNMSEWVNRVDVVCVADANRDRFFYSQLVIINLELFSSNNRFILLYFIDMYILK